MQLQRNRRRTDRPSSGRDAAESHHDTDDVNDNDRILDSLNRSQAVIEFTPGGEILDANPNFTSALGYELHEIVGQHHRIFVDPAEAASSDYEDFWDNLRRGQFQSGEFARYTKHGQEIWIQATYNPVYDDEGTVYKVVKFATDITQQKMAQREIQNRTQAIIEFKPDGTIITANDLFLQTVGYSLDQIVGQHHRMFMPPGEADTDAYRNFWPSLARGEFIQGDFQRVDAYGQDLWLQGAYSPVLDQNGHVYRVVKSVTNATAEIKAKQEAEEVGRQIAQSVTEMSGAIDEIAQTVNRTASLAQAAESSADEATNKVSELDTNSASIGQVIEVIQGLSAQTNLLALNATIEAARAGEAGKGFAVVASEVKELANQTSNAAGDINSSIEAIQAEISTAVDMIQNIAGSVTEVSGMTTTVAAAIEEQSSLMAGMKESADQLLALSMSS
ncbi:MAG: PAS domain-containing methyl-accepting chemotaxis protein [Actinomycetota bacterium]